MVKRKLKRAAMGLMVLSMLAVPVISGAQMPPPGSPPMGMPGMGMPGMGMRGPGREPHPVINHSIRVLERTKMMLQKDTEKDLGGHRVKAINHIDGALEELHQAMAADKQ